MRSAESRVASGEGQNEFAFPEREQIEKRFDELKSLLSRRGWMDSKRLAAFGFTDRELRQIVEHDEHGEILSYPGSPGYKLFDEATIEEIEHAIALKNQARRMLRRFIRYQNRKHKGGRV